MPISEDEFESRVHSSNPLAYHHYHQQQLQMAMSKAEQRKNNKPIMEKKRRARINNCLSELKSLILDAMKKDPARHSKLEKADILEMTVKHLQSVQKQQLSVAMAADPTVVHKFKTGFSECATEVNRFIGRLDGIDAGLATLFKVNLHFFFFFFFFFFLTLFNYLNNRIFPSGRLRRGRPVKGWRQGVEEEIRRCQLPDDLWEDRGQWRLGVAEREAAL
uniref:Deadpan n=1 Tax=Bemisia tabaci TaxID=7038 RepID=A0A451FV06_BEMTA|nr:deadpan [Bemisia tabaci]